MFLTDAEIEQLTGYVLPAWQAKWMKHHGVPFTTARNGHLNVLRSEIERIHGATTKIDDAEGPRFSSIEKAA